MNCKSSVSSNATDWEVTSSILRDLRTERFVGMCASLLHRKDNISSFCHAALQPMLLSSQWEMLSSVRAVRSDSAGAICGATSRAAMMVNVFRDLSDPVAQANACVCTESTNRRSRRVRAVRPEQASTWPCRVMMPPLTWSSTRALRPARLAGTASEGPDRDREVRAGRRHRVLRQGQKRDRPILLRDWRVDTSAGSSGAAPDDSL